MRRFAVLVRATAMEIASEPFVLLVLLASLAVAILAPVFHYHQFGEPTRMARDAGLSAVTVGSLVIAAFAGVKTFRREIESGTIQIALAHAVSRPLFFLAKICGIVLALLSFAVAVGAVSITVVNGAEIGGAIAAVTHEIARVWGPSVAVALAAILFPLVAAAALNRFFAFRFTLSANALVVLVALVGLVYRFNPGWTLRLLPVIAVAASPAFVLAVAAAAFAVRFRSPTASALTALTAAAILPILGNHCLSEALAAGGSVSLGYVVLALGSSAAAVAGFVSLGLHLFENHDLG